MLLFILFIITFSAKRPPTSIVTAVSLVYFWTAISNTSLRVPAMMPHLMPPKSIVSFFFKCHSAHICLLIPLHFSFQFFHQFFMPVALHIPIHFSQRAQIWFSVPHQTFFPPQLIFCCIKPDSAPHFNIGWSFVYLSYSSWPSSAKVNPSGWQLFLNLEYAVATRWSNGCFAFLFLSRLRFFFLARFDNWSSRYRFPHMD